MPEPALTLLALPPRPSPSPFLSPSSGGVCAKDRRLAILLFLGAGTLEPEGLAPDTSLPLKKLCDLEQVTESLCAPLTHPQHGLAFILTSKVCR